MVGGRGERLKGDLIFLFIAWMGRAMPSLTFIISQNSNTWSKENKGEMHCWEKGEVPVVGQGARQKAGRGVLEGGHGKELAGYQGPAGCAVGRERV